MKNEPDSKRMGPIEDSLDELLRLAQWPDEASDPLDGLLRLAQWPKPGERSLPDARRIQRQRKWRWTLAAASAVAAILLAGVVVWTARGLGDKDSNIPGTRCPTAVGMPTGDNTPPEVAHSAPDTLRGERLNTVLAKLRSVGIFEDDTVLDRIVDRRIAEPDGDLEKLVQPLVARRADFEQRLLGRFYMFTGRREPVAVEMLGCIGSDASVPLLLHVRFKSSTHAAAIRALLKLADVGTLAQLEFQEPDAGLRQEISAALPPRDDGQMTVSTPIFEKGDQLCSEVRSDFLPHADLF
jgi:hypothetical protein